MEADRHCWCGQPFSAEGTIHGQPASLWRLLEHQENDHAEVDLTPQLLST